MTAEVRSREILRKEDIVCFLATALVNVCFVGTMCMIGGQRHHNDQPNWLFLAESVAISLLCQILIAVVCNCFRLQIGLFKRAFLSWFTSIVSIILFVNMTLDSEYRITIDDIDEYITAGVVIGFFLLPGFWTGNVAVRKYRKIKVEQDNLSIQAND